MSMFFSTWRYSYFDGHETHSNYYNEISREHPLKSLEEIYNPLNVRDPKTKPIFEDFRTASEEHILLFWTEIPEKQQSDYLKECADLNMGEIIDNRYEV